MRPPSFEARTVVLVDDAGVRCDCPDGTSESVRWADLQCVLVETTDTGPFVEDVFFVLVGSEGGCVVPQSAQGVRDLVARLTELPGFDGEQWARAMACTDNAQFLCWQRAAHANPRP